MYTHTLARAATVGYGEIVPASALSRIVVLCFVFFFLCTIPYQIGVYHDRRTLGLHQPPIPPAPGLPFHSDQSTQTITPASGKLMEAISSRSMYRTKSFRPLRDTEHIVILGRVTFHVLAR